MADLYPSKWTFFDNGHLQSSKCKGGGEKDSQCASADNYIKNSLIPVSQPGVRPFPFLPLYHLRSWPCHCQSSRYSHSKSCRNKKRICNHRSSHSRVPTKTYSATSDDIILSKFRSTNNTTLEHISKCFVTLALRALKGKAAWLSHHNISKSFTTHQLW